MFVGLLKLTGVVGVYKSRSFNDANLAGESTWEKV